MQVLSLPLGGTTHLSRPCGLRRDLLDCRACLPVKLPGWLVAVLRRHVEAVHELSEAELVELGRLLALCSRALHAELQCEKEYVSVYAESPGFNHVHVHIIPRSPNLAGELKGPRIFALLSNAIPEEAVPPDQVAVLCRRLRDRMEGRGATVVSGLRQIAAYLGENLPLGVAQR